MDQRGNGRTRPAPQDSFTAVARIPKPVVAAVTGYALGGGCELALCAESVSPATNAKLGQPEILLGLIPGAGGTQRLARLVGPSKAKDLIFTGRQVKAEEALRHRPGGPGGAGRRGVRAGLAGPRGPRKGPAHRAARRQGVDRRRLETDIDTGLADRTQLVRGAVRDRGPRPAACAASSRRSGQGQSSGADEVGGQGPTGRVHVVGESCTPVGGSASLKNNLKKTLPERSGDQVNASMSSQVRAGGTSPSAAPSYAKSRSRNNSSSAGRRFLRNGPGGLPGAAMMGGMAGLEGVENRARRGHGGRGAVHAVRRRRTGAVRRWSCSATDGGKRCGRRPVRSRRSPPAASP